MAKLSKKKLFQHVENAIRDSGWQVVRLSGASEFPARYEVMRGDRSHRIRVYVWNITHGGGTKRSADEFRIQITSGVSKFVPEPAGKTLILGWSESMCAFGGWDLKYHSGLLGSSPSFQITRQALLDGEAKGFAVHRKGTGEIALAFRPEFIGTYIDQLGPLHALGRIPKEAKLLEKVSTEPDEVHDNDIAKTVSSVPRQYALKVTRRAVRELDFRKRVLDAYNHRCVMCGVQLRLLDAAHVIPVGHPDSTDETTNGIGLCALHHRAYDRTLVTFDEKYRILVSKAHVSDLKAVSFHGGLTGFRKSLRTKILLPSDKKFWPKVAYVRKANIIRGWIG